MNMLLFYCINFKLTSVKQTTSNKQVSTHKNTNYKCLVQIFSTAYIISLAEFAYKTDALKVFAKLTRKNLGQSLIFTKFAA